MPRRGEISEQDQYEEGIRANASYYNVTCHVAQRNTKVWFSDDDLDKAIEFSETVYQDHPEVRAAMVYAVDENKRFAFMGATNRFTKKFKPNVVKVY